MFCLPQELTNLFKEKLKADPDLPNKMAQMSSQGRRELLTEFLGEGNAREVNRVFESKLLLKDQQRGMLTWAKQFSGMKPEAKRDMISRIEKMEDILTPENESAFLQDLAAHKLGVTVSMKEAATIAQMSKKISDTRTAMEQGGDRMEYGRASVAMMNYLNDLKEGAKVRTTAEKLMEGIESTKGLRASLDNSYIGRQGIKAMWTHPRVWAKHSVDSFKRIIKQMKGQAVMDEVNADIVSRENFLNNTYKKMGLAISRLEESFPSTLPEKVPGLRRLYKASEAGFTSQAYLTRADLADLYIKKAKAAGVDVTNEVELKAIGDLVNSLTGRGFGGATSGGKIERAVNATFFSPRFLASNVNTIFLHPLTGAGSSFVRKQAAINLLKIVSGTAAVLATADAIDDDAVEWDARSADFGKIKIGNTRFDITGGMGSIVTLAARLLTMSSKSTTTGVAKKLNTGEFGSQTGWDVLVDFGSNKLSPAASIVKDYLKGETFGGKKPTITGSALSLIVPITLENALEHANEPGGAPILATVILDGLGFGANTYSQKTDWSRNPGVELEAFKEKVGDEKFEKANELFNERVNAWIDEVRRKPEFQALSDEDQQKVVTNKKAELKDEIFKENGFKYKKKKPAKLPKL